MLKKLYYDLTHLTFEKILAKYGIPVIVAILICSIVGQLIIMFIPLQQLNKVDGKILDVRIKSIGVNSSTRDPVYALVISLDNSHIFNIRDTDDKVKMAGILKPGDQIRIYYPTKIVHFLSSGFLGDISQIERGNEVLYNRKDQQTKRWFPICIFIAMLFLSWYLKFYWNNSSKSRNLWTRKYFKYGQTRSYEIIIEQNLNRLLSLILLLI